MRFKVGRLLFCHSQTEFVPVSHTHAYTYTYIHYRVVSDNKYPQLGLGLFRVINGRSTTGLNAV